MISSSVVSSLVDHRIELPYKDGSVREIAAASDNFGIQAMARPVEKWVLAWPRWVG